MPSIRVMKQLKSTCDGESDCTEIKEILTTLSEQQLLCILTEDKFKCWIPEGK